MTTPSAKLGLYFVLSSLVLHTTSARKPNVLFMMADQMRGDLTGSNLLDLPNINSIGENGVRFSRAYSTTPTCTPARAAILTGQKPWNHGMLGYGSIAEKYPFEMPTAMRTMAGYHTAVIGKDHFGWRNNKSISHGYELLDIFDGIENVNDNYCQWFHEHMNNQPIEIGWPGIDNNCWKGRPYALDEALHPTAWVGRGAVEWIKQNGTKMQDEAKPWMLKVSFHRPHSPYSPPKRFLHNVTEDNLPPTRLASDGWDEVYRDMKGCGPNPRGCDQWCGRMPFRDMTLGRRAYRAEVQFVDHWVGNILSTLEQHGLRDSTLIVWMSDHGDCQGDHYLHRKGYAYECAVSVPMLIQWPRGFDLPEPSSASSSSSSPSASSPSPSPQPPPSPSPASSPPQNRHHSAVRGTVISDKVVELRDIMPTILDAAGVAASDYASKVDGRSLLCFFHAGGCQGWREWLDLEHDIVYDGINHWNALVSVEFKYIFHAQTATEQLFNLSSDPFETKDLAGNPAYAPALLLWRERLLSQWKAEGRGSEWFDAHGKLLPRPNGMPYSPNYPRTPGRTSGGGEAAQAHGFLDPQELLV